MKRTSFGGVSAKRSCRFIDLFNFSFFSVTGQGIDLNYVMVCLGMQNEAEQRLIEFCQENAPVIANTLFQQHKRRLYTWTSPDGQH